MTWTCPSCRRTFGRAGQSHECAAALSLEEYFSTGPDWERPVFEAVHDVLGELPDVVVEAVSVGIFFKRRRTFVELRPRTRWVDVGIILPRRLASPRVTRTSASGAMTAQGIRVVEPAQVDAELRGWLTESWAAAAPD